MVRYDFHRALLKSAKKERDLYKEQRDQLLEEIEGVAPEQLPNQWTEREEDGATWSLRIENDSFDGVTETVVVEGACTEDGEEDAFLATPTPEVAREMARALDAYAAAVQRANQSSLSSEASDRDH